MPSAWCVIANVAASEKHFSQGTKVYCLPQTWSDGPRHIRILVRHRGSRNLVEMVFPTKRLTKWRAREVFQPFVVRRISEYEWSEEKAREAVAALLARETIAAAIPAPSGGER